MFGLPKTGLEDWRRVLTTSNGQVTTAPAVPAILSQNNETNQYPILSRFFAAFVLKTSPFVIRMYAYFYWVGKEPNRQKYGNQQSESRMY